MELILPKLRIVWKEWDLRLVILISLFIHILLSILGNRRKYNRVLWIRISVWSAYTAAESVAIFALGIISNNLSDKLEDLGGRRLDPNIELATVWAQCLFFTLGWSGLHNSLCFRRQWALVEAIAWTGFSSFGAIYFILLSWTDEEGSHFSILSIMMFIVGFIKYGERTWVLRAASYQMNRKSV